MLALSHNEAQDTQTTFIDRQWSTWNTHQRCYHRHTLKHTTHKPLSQTHNEAHDTHITCALILFWDFELHKSLTYLLTYFHRHTVNKDTDNWNFQLNTRHWVLYAAAVIVLRQTYFIPPRPWTIPPWPWSLTSWPQHLKPSSASQNALH